MPVVPTNVTEFAQLVVSSRLFTEDEMRELVKKSTAMAGTPEAFANWLVDQGKLTRYQANSLLRGNKTFFLDDYKLVDRIGQGRMAGVYMAVHKLGMRVAVKILPPSRSRDPNSLARFQREASLAMKMDHPRVVKTYHAGAACGLNYIAMELLDGETLDDRVDRKGKLPMAETLRIAQQALEGLQHMHEKNLVHRDLKPANLMLVMLPGLGDDGNYAVKVMDIGLGRELFDEDQPAENLTMAGTTVGTHNYMPPEQWRDSHAADIRSDLYSLGCVLYFAITGRAPFPEKNLVVKMTKHLNEMPAIPDYGGFPHVVPLHAFLWKLLAKKQEDRHQTPAEALREVLALARLGASGPSARPEASPIPPTPAVPVSAPRPRSKPTLPPVDVPAFAPEQSAAVFEPVVVPRDASTGKPGKSSAALFLWIAGGILSVVLVAGIVALVILKNR